MNCFENYDVISNDDKFELYLSGEFYCLNDKEKVNINVSTMFEVAESNGILNDNAYVWEINKDNVNNYL